MTAQERLRIFVRNALKQTTASATPNFYAMLQTTDGYKKAEDMIINFALTNQISITAAIAQLESTLSE